MYSSSPSYCSYCKVLAFMGQLCKSFEHVIFSRESIICNECKEVHEVVYVDIKII
jgi:hypothetical protein